MVDIKDEKEARELVKHICDKVRTMEPVEVSKFFRTLSEEKLEYWRALIIDSLGTYGSGRVSQKPGAEHVQELWEEGFRKKRVLTSGRNMKTREPYHNGLGFTIDCGSISGGPVKEGISDVPDPSLRYLDCFTEEDLTDTWQGNGNYKKKG